MDKMKEGQKPNEQEQPKKVNNPFGNEPMEDEVDENGERRGVERKDDGFDKKVFRK